MAEEEKKKKKWWEKFNPFNSDDSGWTSEAPSVPAPFATWPEYYAAQDKLKNLAGTPLESDRFFVDTQEEADRRNQASMGRYKYFVKPSATSYAEDSDQQYQAWKEQQDRVSQSRQDEISRLHGDLGLYDPMFEEQDYSDIEESFKKQGIYKGQVPMGSAVVGGKLIGGQQPPQVQQEQQRPMFTQGADVQGAPIMMPQAMQTPTPSGGVARSYSAVGGSKFNPQEDPEKQKKVNYGGGNIGYGGGGQIPRG